MAEHYGFQDASLEKFRRKLQDWKVFRGNRREAEIRTSRLEEIIEKLKEIGSIGRNLIVDYTENKSFGTLSEVHLIKGFLYLGEYENDSAYLKLKPNELVIHADILDRRRNALVVITDEAPIRERSTLDEDGCWSYTTIEAEVPNKPEPQKIISLARGNMKVLIHPKGSIYAEHHHKRKVFLEGIGATLL